MRWWWVNHFQTYQDEIAGGYLWSPRSKANGFRNQFYENMRLVEPGDLVVSFSDAQISTVGTVIHRAMPSRKPAEFVRNENWQEYGWLVGVAWTLAPIKIRPKEHIKEFADFLPNKYSPLTVEGKGLQGVYLAEIPEAMADVLLAKLGVPNRAVGVSIEPAFMTNSAIDEVEEAIETEIMNDTAIDSTTKVALVNARRGQGRFRSNLLNIETGCRITGVTDGRLLRASHIKPWCVCETNHERLDGNNGLLLTPTFDALFDPGYISFSDDGGLLVGDAIPDDQLSLIGLNRSKHPIKRPFSKEQIAYLKYHRINLFSRHQR